MVEMRCNSYEISNYTSEDIEGIVSLFSFLRETDEEANREYFIWKHQRNPFLKKPIGIVVKYGGQVVGFAGALPTEWRIGDSKIMMLSGTDIVLHPEHRGKGLHAGTIKTRYQLYSNEYSFAVSFTAGNISMRKPIQFGSKIIATKHYLRHLNLLRVFRSKLSRSDRDMLDLGCFGDIDVSNSICSADISRIAIANLHPTNKLCLNKTPDFLEWRFSKPKTKYVYFYHLSKSKIDAYVILSNDIHAHVLDYGEEPESHGITKIFSFILSHTRFSSISIMNVGLPNNLEVFLRNKHFYTFDQIERFRNREFYNLPIFIRPMKETYDEDDWFIDGVDVRDINNWHITEMCCDE